MAMNLSKGSTSPVTGTTGTPVSKLLCGVGWDVSGGGQKGLVGRFNRFKGVDLDVSAIARDSAGTPIGGAWFDNLRAFGGAITHTGDNKTGKGDGDDEQVVLDLASMPQEVHSIAITLSSYKGATFEKVNNAQCRLVDLSAGGDGVELGTIYIPIQGDYTAALVARVTRDGNGGWTVENIGKFGHGKTWQQMQAFASQ
jgi:tellurium resistance protein TerZ